MFSPSKVPFNAMPDARKFQTSRGPQVQPSQGGYETLSKSVKKICPSCGSDMVKRVARKGPNSGNKFGVAVLFRNAGLLRTFNLILFKIII